MDHREAREKQGAIAVVGGSAAGFYAAGLLARAGQEVRVVEQTDALQPAERTLIVTRRMRELLGAAGEASVVNEIRNFELFTDGRAAQVKLAKPDLIIERARLILSLATEAQAVGAKIELGKRFQSLEASPRALPSSL